MTNKDNKPGAQRGRDDELLTIGEVADIVRVPIATLRYWRHLGTGPHSSASAAACATGTTKSPPGAKPKRRPQRRMSPGQVSGSGELDTWQCHHPDVACLGSRR